MNSPVSSDFLGSAEQVYMSSKHLYVGGHNWSNSTTRIAKVDLNVTTGAVAVSARGTIHGVVKDRWAFKELSGGGLLSVVSTGGGWGQALSNQLSVLEQEGDGLNVIASTEKFGKSEDIRAVRYVGDMAYAVTFQKTDPLFAIDLSNPRAPKILGELHVPGFSAYLHPLKDGRLAGVGFDAKEMGGFAWLQGIQISLFDTRNPMDLKRLDNKVIGLRGSFSDPTTDAHAFYFDSARDRIGVPVVELGGTIQNDWDYGNTLVFSGAVVYEAKDALKEIARLTHIQHIPGACKTLMAYGQWWQWSNPSYDINRLVELDGSLLSISRFAVVSHGIEDLTQVTGTLAFSSTEEESACQVGGVR